MRKMLLCTLVSAAMLVATAQTASAATAAPYALQNVGDSQEYFVHGTTANLIQREGSASVSQPVQFLGPISRVVVECDADPPCVGLLVVM